ncbi:MAG: tRNA (adenosine(37)-N6)-dimethylallyltransferase MiaA [Candidatus Portnoybacteria bacterium]|nr:tRNA (adenosine(37)-N6)-dimethylallyltransferase MiaA [Candidatus Portnoybacteria bacterium]
MSIKTRNQKLIIVLGPTASGKSDLAVSLAKKINGEVISADSRQVYKGLDIGSGKITKEEMQGIPHCLLGVADPKRRFSVAQYKKLAQVAIKKIQRQGKIPIICGGTGFYIQAVVDNIALPEVKPDWKLRKQLEKFNTDELFKKLKKLDPRRSRNIDSHNQRRLIRALEIVIKSGKPVPLFVIPAKAGIQNLKSGFRVKPGMTDYKNLTPPSTLILGIKKSKKK